MDEAEGVPLALARRQRVGRRHVELRLDQGRDQMVGKPGMDRIVPRLALLVVARGGALHPVGPPRSVDAGAGAASRPVRHVGDRLAAIDQHARHVVVVIDLLVVVADHDHRVEASANQPVAQPIDRRHRLAVTPCVLVRRDLRQHRGRRGRQQVVVGRRPPVGVKMRAMAIELLEQRPFLGRHVEHRRVRRAGAEDDAGHDLPPGLRCAEAGASAPCPSHYAAARRGSAPPSAPCSARAGRRSARSPPPRRDWRRPSARRRHGRPRPISRAATPTTAFSSTPSSW